MSIQDSRAAKTAYTLFDVPTPSPIVFSSTHSGRFYPPTLLRQSRLPTKSLQRGEDPYVDVLIEPVGEHGIPRLTATFARAYVDLNRDPREIDPALFSPAPDAPSVRASERVAAGLGVIPRVLAPGEPLYEGTLPLAEADRRLTVAHAPVHTAIERLLARARARHGYALLVDVHSMPSQHQPNAAQIVVGDLHGRAAASTVVGVVEAALRSVGFRSARNVPYAGAYTLERHGAPFTGIHAIQLEIDRALYLDAAHRALASSSARLAKRLGTFAGVLVERLAALDLGRGLPIAAE